MKIDFNNLYTHFVFITYERGQLIPEKNRARIEKYITGIVSKYASKLYAIYANPEHLHMLVSRSPRHGEEELASIIAKSTEKFINENKLSIGVFKWQDSGAAFSVSKQGVDAVCKYIMNQPEHHKKESFAQEYDRYLRFYKG
jgi:REP element-mobilizing transposase RayT